MLTAMAHVVTIVDGESDGRALQFMLFAQKFDETLIDRAEKYGIFDAKTATRRRSEVAERYKAIRERFEKQGVTPARIGTSDRTWHGLNTERDLFTEMKMPHVYELDYAWLSDEGHVNIGAAPRPGLWRDWLSSLCSAAARSTPV